MIEHEDMLQFVIHRGKMLLLSRIVEFDLERRTIRAEYDGGPSCLFFEPALGGIPSWAGFECMAQGISALWGIACRKNGMALKPGVILQISDMNIFEPVITSKAVIELAQNTQFDAIYNFEGRVSCDKKLCAEAHLMVMEVDNLEALLNR
jgi:predicted hotdog family 3-hydroxylacyl-ACP dehydratase